MYEREEKAGTTEDLSVDHQMPRHLTLGNNLS